MPGALCRHAVVRFDDKDLWLRFPSLFDISAGRFDAEGLEVSGKVASERSGLLRRTVGGATK
jgi:hypothetical protein